MSARRVSGQAMVEFLIIIPALILIIFGTIQAALIYSTKSSLNYATFQAARLGAVNHAQYHDLRRGLLRGMYPMFSQYPEEIRMNETAMEVDNYVRIIRISPSQSSMSAWQEDHIGLLKKGQTVQAIPNDNLMYRSAVQNPVSIQDANLLKIRVQYCMKLIVPMVEHLLSSASRFNTRRSATSFKEVSEKTTDQYSATCKSRKGFVVTSEATVRMQSPAIDDTANCNNGKLSCP